MKSLFLMIGFFTRLPVPNVEFTEDRYRRGMKLVPIVGLIIGIVLFLISAIGFVAQPFVRGAVLLCAYIIISGGLHFDGLADTGDGVFSGRSREQSLEIMKDSRIGVFGTLSLLMAGIFYFALFTTVPSVSILIFPIIGRACCLISASLAPYARADGMGKQAGLSGGPAAVVSAIIAMVGASALAIPVANLVQSQVVFSGAFLDGDGFSLLLVALFSLIAAAAAVLVTIGMTAHFKKKLGGITGDTFGAVIEVSSIAWLFVFSILYQMLPL